jgi:hypothetical protein
MTNAIKALAVMVAMAIGAIGMSTLVPLVAEGKNLN